MEIEYDKEIDILLRQARKGEVASVGDSRFQVLNSTSDHFDADEISAFAENALPEKAKARYIAHFADCDSCRKNLSNLISLNAETEGEFVPVEKIAAVPSAVSWYRRIFAFPNLAYTMGGLLAVFGGIIGFIAIQNFNDSRSSEISQISEKAQVSREMTAENKSPLNEPNSSGSANTNSATVYSSNTAANSSADSSMMNSNMSVAAKPNVSATLAPKDELSRENNLSAANKSNGFSLNEQEQSRKESPIVSAPAEPQAAAPPPADKKTKPESRAQSDSSSNNDQVADLPLNGRQSGELQKNRVLDAPAAKSKPSESTNAESVTVRGKNFTRRNNVWFDTSYKDQPVVRITRGTKQYKNLDKDLRGIAENLGGTVVIVWKEKAYRIQ